MSLHSNADLTKFLEVGVQAAKLGGEILKQFWGKLTHIREKGFTWDLVTEADIGSEKAILDCIKDHFPNHNTLSEEAGLLSKHAHEYLWVIDPLDGTTNYTHQYPMVAVSIGLLHQGKPIVGIVYNPILNELFKGAQGQGAYLNGEKIQVSLVHSIDRSLLATGFAYDRQENRETNYAEFCHLTHFTQGVRRAGAAAIDLAYVAAGRLDGFWERGLQPWDMAAGTLLISEAGGTVTDYDLRELDFYAGRILATNGKIHSEISKRLLDIRKGL